MGIHALQITTVIFLLFSIAVPLFLAIWIFRSCFSARRNTPKPLSMDEVGRIITTSKWADNIECHKCGKTGWHVLGPNGYECKK